MDSRATDDPRLQDPEFVELVNDFIAALDEALRQLEHAVEAGDLPALERQGRILAETAKDYGFADLARLGSELADQAARKAGARRLEALLAELRQAVHGLSGHVLIEKPRE